MRPVLVKKLISGQAKPLLKNYSYQLACQKYFGKYFSSQQKPLENFGVLKRTGKLYCPPKGVHLWEINLTWLLGHFQKGTQFIIMSEVSLGQLTRRKSQDMSGFSREVAVCYKQGYRFEYQNGQIIMRHSNPLRLKDITFDQINISEEEMLKLYKAAIENYNQAKLKVPLSEEPKRDPKKKREVEKSEAFGASASSPKKVLSMSSPPLLSSKKSLIKRRMPLAERYDFYLHPDSSIVPVNAIIFGYGSGSSSSKSTLYKITIIENGERVRESQIEIPNTIKLTEEPSGAASKELIKFLNERDPSLVDYLNKIALKTPPLVEWEYGSDEEPTIPPSSLSPKASSSSSKTLAGRLSAAEGALVSGDKSSPPAVGKDLLPSKGVVGAASTPVVDEDRGEGYDLALSGDRPEAGSGDLLALEEAEGNAERLEEFHPKNKSQTPHEGPGKKARKQ